MVKIAELLPALILLSLRCCDMQDAETSSGSWLIILLTNDWANNQGCTASLLSRTPGQKSETSDLLITSAYCLDLYHPYTKKRLQYDASDLRARFFYYDSNGYLSDMLLYRIKKILHQNATWLDSPKDYVTLLQLSEGVNGLKDLEPVVLPESSEISHERCFVTNWIQDYTEEYAFDGIPKVLEVQSHGACDENNTFVDQGNSTPYKYLYAATPVLCDVGTENSRQLFGLVKQNYNAYLEDAWSTECIAVTNFLDWTKKALMEKMI